MSDSVNNLKIAVSKGFAALEVMLQERTGRLERLEDALNQQREQIAHLQTTIAVLETKLGHVQDVTGKHEIVKDQAELTILRKKEQESKESTTHKLEAWKTTVPLLVATVTGIFSLVVAVLHALFTWFGAGS